MKLTVSDITKTAMAAALLCVMAPLCVYAGTIPISLATFAVYIISAVFGKIKAPAAVLIYTALGAIGLPVFSNFGSGIAKLAGPTGGYIIGYIPCAVVIGLIVDKWDSKLFVYPLAMIAGTILCYSFGTLWYMYVTKSNLATALSVCVIPFLLFDAIKIVVASVSSFEVRKVVKKL